MARCVPLRVTAVIVREHTVVVAEGGRPVRVICGWCESQHNFRGGDPDERPASMPSRSRSSGEARLMIDRMAGFHLT